MTRTEQLNLITPQMQAKALGYLLGKLEGRELSCFLPDRIIARRDLDDMAAYLGLPPLNRKEQNEH
jgi:hypothetical protein